MDLNDLLQGPLKNVILGQLSQKIGIEDTSKTESALESSVGLIMNALAKNVSKPEGAQSLIGALTRDHDGSILDHVGEFLGGNYQAPNESMTNGVGILKHLLGGKQEEAAQTIAKDSGLDAGKIMQMMATLAPLVMGYLGKANSQQQNNPAGLIDLIMNSTKNVNAQKKDTSIFTKILDKDGDGSIMDDLAGMGIKSLLNRFLKK